MSHSTTATATHIISKYSRSYPSSQQNGAPESEWQHFSNPVIRLVLDITKSSVGELASVRLRIIWSMNSENNSMDVDQREIVFEDLDLLAFSNLPSHNKQSINQAQSLPLKAVYRDAMVGIRYLHPRLMMANAAPVYRRFQMTFLTSGAALQFIDAIRAVCPCKAPTPPGYTVTSAPTLAQTQGSYVSPFSATMAGRTPSIMPPLEFPAPTRLPKVHVSALSSAPQLPPQMRSSPSMHPSQHIMMSSSQPHLNMDASSSQPPASSPAMASASQPSHDINYHSVLTTAALKPSSANQGEKSTLSVGNVTKNTSLPSSSPPSSSINSNSSMMPPPSVSPSAAQPTGPPMNSTYIENTPNLLKAQFLASLKEAPSVSLSSLSNDELESLVGEVVREEGFVKLLEKLDSMWVMKGFLGR